MADREVSKAYASLLRLSNTQSETASLVTLHLLKDHYDEVANQGIALKLKEMTPDAIAKYLDTEIMPVRSRL